MKETPLEQDPAIYLRQPSAPTSSCHILVEQVGSHDGDPAPMHMLAKVAVRLHQAADWMARWDGREKLARRLAGLVVSAALANVAAIGYHWLSSHDARIVAEAEARALREAEIEYRRSIKEQIEQLQLSVRQLQQTLMRMSRSHPQSQPDANGQYPWPNAPLPDHFSAWDPDGHASPAGIAFVCDSGLVRLQRPKLQNWQLRMTRWHSRLLLQTSPQTLGIGCGLGGAIDGIGLQPIASVMRKSMTLGMDTLYPLLHTEWKEIAP